MSKPFHFQFRINTSPRSDVTQEVPEKSLASSVPSLLLRYCGDNQKTVREKAEHAVRHLEFPLNSKRFTLEYAREIARNIYATPIITSSADALLIRNLDTLLSQMEHHGKNWSKQVLYERLTDALTLEQEDAVENLQSPIITRFTYKITK